MLARNANAGVNFVAPFAGAWIEMLLVQDHPQLHPVAPFAGAWIEILTHPAESLLIPSPVLSLGVSGY